MSIANNSVVSMHYQLKDAENGEILDSNIEGKPLSFIIGKGQIIPGLESQMQELNEGEQKEIRVASEQAYGKYDEKALQTLPKEQFAGIELMRGMSLYGQGEQGETVQVTVKDFTDSDVTVDFNHPLAGRDLIFDVNITEVREATPEELQSGVVGGAHVCGCGAGGCGSHEGDHKEEGECCGSHEGHSHKEEGECCGSGHGKEHGGGSCCGSH